ncbi:7630_t:CDS:2, partial [Cetraspora pellucida]
LDESGCNWRLFIQVLTFGTGIAIDDVSVSHGKELKICVAKLE